MPHILVVDDERSMREFFHVLLERQGHRISSASNVEAALRVCKNDVPEIVFTDLKLPDGNGIDILKWVREHLPDTQIIIMTAFGTTQNAVEAMRLGAYDYLIKPVKVDEIEALTAKALEKSALIRENRTLRAQLSEQGALGRIVGLSLSIQRVRALIERVAVTKSTVLIEGESGTGKELVARAIHEASTRHRGPFVAINCGAIAETLIESELFGYVAGAFTGAGKGRPGLFESAQGGTLFLDEIGELPQSLQVKLLRVLQERVVRRVGEEQERSVDVRIIAATNRELQKRVQEGSFREDLFYRLNVVRISMPPLRERREDIAAIARGFVIKHAKDSQKDIEGLTPEAQHALTNYDFPGNVRELENFIERALALANGTHITLDDLPDEVRARSSQTGQALVAHVLPEQGIALETVLVDLEKNLIEQAMQRSGGVKTKAAELLGLSFRSFRYRLQKLGLQSGADAELDGE